MKKLNHKHEKEMLELKIKLINNLEKKYQEEEFIFEKKYSESEKEINDKNQSENNINKSKNDIDK